MSCPITPRWRKPTLEEALRKAFSVERSESSISKAFFRSFQQNLMQEQDGYSFSLPNTDFAILSYANGDKPAAFPVYCLPAFSRVAYILNTEEVYTSLATALDYLSERAPGLYVPFCGVAVVTNRNIVKQSEQFLSKEIHRLGSSEYLQTDDTGA